VSQGGVCPGGHLSEGGVCPDTTGGSFRGTWKGVPYIQRECPDPSLGISAALHHDLIIGRICCGIWGVKLKHRSSLSTIRLFCRTGFVRSPNGLDATPIYTQTAQSIMPIAHAPLPNERAINHFHNYYCCYTRYYILLLFTGPDCAQHGLRPISKDKQANTN